MAELLFYGLMPKIHILPEGGPVCNSTMSTQFLMISHLYMYTDYMLWFMYWCSSAASIIASEASQPPAGTRFMTGRRPVKKASNNKSQCQKIQMVYGWRQSTKIP